MKFQLIDKAKNEFPVHRLCGVLGVSQSGYFAWKDRSGSRRQRDDMVLLAHVRGAVAICVGIDFGAVSSVTRLPDHAARSIV